MQGTAILFGNGSSDDAMRSFPPSKEVRQNSFVAVFIGTEEPTQEQFAIMEGTTPEAQKAQDAMAALFCARKSSSKSKNMSLITSLAD